MIANTAPVIAASPLVRTSLPFSKAAPVVWFKYSADRNGEHPAKHLKHFRGILQADAFFGYNRLYEDGRIIEGACRSHVDRPPVEAHHLLAVRGRGKWTASAVRIHYTPTYSSWLNQVGN